MQRAGWSIDNPHMLQTMIRMTVKEKIAEQKPGVKFTDRSTQRVKARWSAYAQELCERDPAFSGEALTARCHAHYDQAHTHMMEFKARSCMPNPQMQFPVFFEAIHNKPIYSPAARVAAATDSDSPI